MSFCIGNLWWRGKRGEMIISVDGFILVAGTNEDYRKWNRKRKRNDNTLDYYKWFNQLDHLRSKGYLSLMLIDGYQNNLVNKYKLNQHWLEVIVWDNTLLVDWQQFINKQYNQKGSRSHKLNQDKHTQTHTQSTKLWEVSLIKV